jgi:Scaffold protein Nfu/NifU N terminal/HEAT repeats
MVLERFICILLASLVYYSSVSSIRSKSHVEFRRSCLPHRRSSLQAVQSIESTPNPSSFKISLDEPILSGSGQTFLEADQIGCPEAINTILRINGIESVYAMPDWICVTKLPKNSYNWGNILPECVTALGGAAATSDIVNFLNRFSIPPSIVSQDTDQLCIQIRLQLSNGIPIQLEASDGILTKRQSLSPRFASAMNTFITIDESKGGGKMKFFEGRSWTPRGNMYRNTIEEALSAAVEDVETLYSDDRLNMLSGSVQTGQSSVPSTVNESELYSLNDKTALLAVDKLCKLCDGFRENTEPSEMEKSGLLIMTKFVLEASGSVAARRMAIAYLGSCSAAAAPSFKPFVDDIFRCLSQAFTHEKAAGLRRTAGDALSDFGDHRAVPSAINRLLSDPSKLVRWRAARIIGELSGTGTGTGTGTGIGIGEGVVVDGGSTSIHDVTTASIEALKAATLVPDQSFEVVFECMSSISVLQGDNKSSTTMPAWTQIAQKKKD